jgi:predicted nucleic acid-binding protein
VKYLLDTNIYFAILFEPDFLDRYRDTLLRIGPRTYLSSVVKLELLQGAKGDRARANVSRATLQLERAGRAVAPLHADWVRAGSIQGRIWDRAPSLRTKRLQNDILIACTARRIGATIVTDNQRDFHVIQAVLTHRAVSMAALAAATGV